MPRRRNKYPGISKYSRGGYFARVSFKGKEYSKVLPTLKEAIRWKSKMEVDLKRCPRGIVYCKGVWSTTISTPVGLRTSDSIDLDELILWREQNLSAITGGYWRDLDRGNQTLGEYIEHWKSTKLNLAGKTKSVYNSLLNCHFSKILDTPLIQLTTPSIKEWALDLQKQGIGTNTVKQSHDLLRQILNLAVNDEILVRNPVVGIPIQKVIRKSKRVLTQVEVTQLAVECVGYEILIKLTASLGFRMQEVLALKIRDINLLKREIHVTRAWSTDESGKRIISSTKTKQDRVVPLPDFLYDDIEKLMSGRSVDDWLFSGVRGESLDYGWFRRRIFMPAIARLGFRGVTPHSLRHTAISQMISAGTPITSVSGVAGHSNPQVTLAIYAHEFREDSRKYINQIWSKNESESEQERNKTISTVTYEDNKAS